MKIKGIYGESELPDNKLWIKDSIENRLIFSTKIWKSKGRIL